MMRRLLILALLDGLRLAAQTCPISSMTITEIGDTWVGGTVVWDASITPTHLKLARALDPSVDLTDIPGTYWVTKTGQAFFGAQDLAPGTTYNFALQYSTSGAGGTYALDYALADCQTKLFPDGVGAQSGKNYSAIDRGDGTLIAQFTTLADGGMPTPALPTHSLSLSDFSTVTGSVRTVTLDGNGKCVDFELQLLDAIADATSGGLDEAVDVPAGGECHPDKVTTVTVATLPASGNWTGRLRYVGDGASGTDCTTGGGSTWVLCRWNGSAWTNSGASFRHGFSIDGNTGSGHVLVRGLYADEDALPKLGQPADPSLKAGMAKLLFYPDTENRNYPLISGSTGGGIRFQNLVIGVPPVDEIAAWKLPITSITDNGSVFRMYVSTPATPAMINIGIQGPATTIFADGMQRKEFHHGSTAVQGANLGTHVSVTLGDDPGLGDFTAGAIGYSLYEEVVSATKEEQPTLTTAAPHGWTGFHSYALTSCTSGTCTTATTHTMQSGHTYQIYGSDSGTCDGFYTGASGAGSTTMPLSPAPANCTGGSIRRLGSAVMFELNNVTSNPMARSCLVTFPTTTTIKLWLCWGGTGGAITPDWTGEAGTISGRISYGVRDWPELVDISGMQGVIFERVIFDAPGPPVRIPMMIRAAGSEDVLIANNFVSGISQWWPVDAHREHSELQDISTTNLTVGTFVDGRECVDCQFLNNTVVNSNGFFFQSVNDGQERNPEQITVSRNRYYVDLSLVAGMATNPGTATIARQWMELKDGGFEVDLAFNSILSWTTTSTGSPHILGAAILHKVNNTVSPRRLQDITIRGNIAECPLCWGVGGFNYDGATTPDIRLPRNLLVEDNFTIGKEVAPAVRGEQAEIAGGLYETWPGGHSVFRRITNLTYRNNTAVYPQIDAAHTTQSSAIFMDGTAWVGRINVQDILWADGGVATYNRFYSSANGGSTEANGWNKNYPQDTTEPSPLATKSGIVAIPCNVGIKTSDFDSTNAAHSAVASIWSGYGGVSLPTESADGQSCNQRLAAVFGGTDFQATGAYAGKGADLDVIQDGHRWIRDDVATTVEPDQFTIEFTAPTSGEACYLAVMAPGGSWTSFTASTGSASRTVTATGLSSGTAYAYRLGCVGGPFLKGAVTTL